MTNEQIIFNESCRLMEEGTIKGSGNFVKVLTVDGEVIVEAPETIHTFQGWKERGYSVKKGEKSFIKFPIWKHTRKMLNTNTGNADLDKMNTNINSQGGETKMLMKMAAFFTFEQVEAIKM